MPLERLTSAGRSEYDQPTERWFPTVMTHMKAPGEVNDINVIGEPAPHACRFCGCYGNFYGLNSVCVFCRRFGWERGAPE